MFANRFALVVLAVLPLFVFAGCPQGDGHDQADAGGAGGGGTGGGDPIVIAPANALASPCSGGAECASGYCVDGVCCDSPCDGQCLSCALAGATGHCGPIAQGPDPVSTTPCIGESSCFLNPATSLSTCKIIDGASCSTDADCGTGHCSTYYLDADGDGYGTATTAKFCNELNGAPPAGYASYPGDCCDLDSGANPGFSSSTFLQFADACGSFDWNCNGVVTPQYSSCPGHANAACGADCVISTGFSTFKDFTQACN
jgi:hypothetical protein